MRGSLTKWDEIRAFFVKRGFDKDKLEKNCFDGMEIVMADIHEPLEGYANIKLCSNLILTPCFMHP